MVTQDFTSKTVFLDTAPLIYFIEGQSLFQPILLKLFDQNDKGDFLFITSSITLLEVLVKPLRESQTSIARQYKNILTQANSITIFDVTSAIAEQAANLRATYNLKTPDSIQLATAIELKADYFLTNDIRLKAVQQITVVTLAELQ